MRRHSRRGSRAENVMGEIEDVTVDPVKRRRLSRRDFIQAMLATVPTVVGTQAIFMNTASAATTAASGVITTVIGGGPLGDGGPATSATLSMPWSVGIDAVGNAYIADVNYNRIRLAAADTGLMSTVAGSGLPGFAGDGGAATSARLTTPWGAVPDGAGNLLVVDTGNSRIRRVDGVTRVITTIAGSGDETFNGDGQLAKLASLSQPRAVVLDSSGNLFIADTQHHRVRVVNLGQAPAVLYPDSPTPLVVDPGYIATVAGTGVAGDAGDAGPARAAQLSLPSSVAFDSRGDLYIADLYNQRVRVVNAANGTITTIAGTGEPGVTGDGGPASSAPLSWPSGVALDSGDNLYIGQQRVPRVRRVDRTSGVISAAAGRLVSGFFGDGGLATQALLGGPTGVALDARDNLYIADRSNARVRRVDSLTRRITTVASSSAPGQYDSGLSAVLNTPGGIAFDPRGRLLIADEGNHRVWLVQPGGRIVTIAGIGDAGYSGDGNLAWRARLQFPADVTTDRVGNLFIADQLNHRVRRVDAATGTIVTVAGNGLPGYSGDNIPAQQARVSFPRGLAVDGSGNLYIADIGNLRIRFVNLGAQLVTLFASGPAPLVVPPGRITTVAGTGSAGSGGDGGPSTSAELTSPRGLVLDEQGNLYLTEGGADLQDPRWPPSDLLPNSRVRKVNAQTGIIDTVAGTDVAGYNGDNIPARSASINAPRGLALDAVGNLYIADTLNNRIRRVDALTQVITTVVGNGDLGFAGDGGPATSASLFTPRHLAFGPRGNLYVADTGNARIRRVSVGV
jgi:sugar lactone lactonase YvrE